MSPAILSRSVGSCRLIGASPVFQEEKERAKKQLATMQSEVSGLTHKTVGFEARVSKMTLEVRRQPAPHCQLQYRE